MKHSPAATHPVLLPPAFGSFRAFMLPAGILTAVLITICKGRIVPTGKVRFYDAGRGFGFITDDDGRDVFLHASALPSGVENPRPGTRVEFSVADGRKGPQALSVTLLERTPSLARSQRKPAADMVGIVEDLIKLLDQASNRLHAGRNPERAEAKKIAAVMRAVADEFDV